MTNSSMLPLCTRKEGRERGGRGEGEARDMGRDMGRESEGGGRVRRKGGRESFILNVFTCIHRCVVLWYQ